MDHYNILVVYPHPADSATEAAGYSGPRKLDHW